MITKITIQFDSCDHKEGMKQRNALDKWTKKLEKKLNVFPKYIDGNFIRLKYWLLEKKEFNKNPKKLKSQFWKELKNICKKIKMRYNENDNI